MSDKAINLLSARFGDITVAEDIKSIIKWAEVIEGSQQRLCDILVTYNNEIDNPVSADVRHQKQKSRIVGILQGGSSQPSASQQGSISQKRARTSNVLQLPVAGPSDNKRNKPI
jgi:hypothetical protein